MVDNSEQSFEASFSDTQSFQDIYQTIWRDLKEDGYMFLIINKDNAKLTGKEKGVMDSIAFAYWHWRYYPPQSIVSIDLISEPFHFMGENREHN